MYLSTFYLFIYICFKFFSQFCSLESERKIEVSPGESTYFLFLFPSDVDMVLVKAISEDDICAMVSIQNTSVIIYNLVKKNLQNSYLFSLILLKNPLLLKTKFFISYIIQCFFFAVPCI